MIWLQRREFITLIGGAAAAWPLVARAQQPVTSIPRVGWLVTGSPAEYRFSLAAFRDGLKALSYIEGQNITIEYRWAEGNVDRLPKLANELVEQKVDIILAGGALGAEAAKRATSLIPIIAAGVGDLAELGLVTSLARPGGNLTGFGLAQEQPRQPAPGERSGHRPYHRHSPRRHGGRTERLPQWARVRGLAGPGATAEFHRRQTSARRDIQARQPIFAPASDQRRQR